MLQCIKTELHTKINELFAEAAVDELAGDIDGYKIKLAKIIQVADVLEVDTEVNFVSFNLKDVLNK